MILPLAGCVTEDRQPLLCGQCLSLSTSNRPAMQKALTLILCQVMLAGAQDGVVYLDIERKVVDYEPSLQRRYNPTIESSVTNGHIGYFTKVKIGTPGQELSLHLDTGSADLWVPYTSAKICRVKGASNCKLGTCKCGALELDVIASLTPCGQIIRSSHSHIALPHRISSRSRTSTKARLRVTTSRTLSRSVVPGSQVWAWALPDSQPCHMDLPASDTTIMSHCRPGETFTTTCPYACRG